jgi:hypothetical protein
MNHRLFTGELQIELDGRTMVHCVRSLLYSTSHQFRLPNFWLASVEINSYGLDCKYELWLEGRIIPPVKDSDTLLRGSSSPTDNLLRPSIASSESDRKELLRPPINKSLKT